MEKQMDGIKANIGLVGLGVMGRMLALNMSRHGFRIAGYDLDAEKVRSFGQEQSNSDAPLIP